MKEKNAVSDLLLKKGQVRKISRTSGDCQIICQSGKLWLTRPEDCQDLILEVGERFGAAGTIRDLVIEALEDSRIQFEYEH